MLANENYELLKFYTLGNLYEYGKMTKYEWRTPPTASEIFKKLLSLKVGYRKCVRWCPQVRKAVAASDQLKNNLSMECGFRSRLNETSK